MKQGEEFLKHTWIDPVIPAPGQLWQARDRRDGGEVQRIDRIEHDIVAHFAPGRVHYVLVENLRLCWRCVDHVPLELLMLDGKFITSWRDMALAAERFAARFV